MTKTSHLWLAAGLALSLTTVAFAQPPAAPAPKAARVAPTGPKPIEPLVSINRQMRRLVSASNSLI